MEGRVKLSNEELISSVEKIVHELSKTGGRSWSLQVPVNFNKDPDMLILEVCKRLKADQPFPDRLKQLHEDLDREIERLLDGKTHKDFTGFLADGVEWFKNGIMYNAGCKIDLHQLLTELEQSK